MTVLIIIAAIIALPLVIALFVRKDYALERTTTINKPVAEVFDFIKHLRNQEKYSVWVQADPNIKRDYTGTDGTVGFVAAWDSADKNVGKGSQTITGIAEGQRMDTRLHFIKPMEAYGDSYFTTEAAGNATVVKWGMSSRMKYPMNIIIGGIEKMLGKDLEKSLAQMKNVLESK